MNEWVSKWVGNTRIRHWLMKQIDWSECVSHIFSHIESCDGTWMRVICVTEKYKKKKQIEIWRDSLAYDMILWLLDESFMKIKKKSFCANSFCYATLIMLPELSLVFRYCHRCRRCRHRHSLILSFAHIHSHTQPAYSFINFLVCVFI